MANDTYAFRLRHARRFHLQRLYQRRPVRFVLSLVISAFAISILALCWIVFAYASGMTSPSPQPPRSGFHLFIGFLITFGVGPTLWLLVHTYRPKLDFYADSIFIHDWSQSRSVSRSDVGKISVAANGTGATVSIANLGVNDLTINRPANVVADEIESLGFDVTRDAEPSL